MERKIALLISFSLMFETAKSTIPGMYFWKPRLSIDLTVPTTEPIMREYQKPTKYNVEQGVVVLINSFQLGMAVVAVSSAACQANSNPHIHPFQAHYHSDAYRWLLRYLSVLPNWLSGNGGHFTDTLKLWKARFRFTNDFLPQWLRPVFPYVSQNSWNQEQTDYRRFKKYSMKSFAKHFRYPDKQFNFFLSHETKETNEEEDSRVSYDYLTE